MIDRATSSYQSILRSTSSFDNSRSICVVYGIRMWIGWIWHLITNDLILHFMILLWHIHWWQFRFDSHRWRVLIILSFPKCWRNSTTLQKTETRDSGCASHHQRSSIHWINLHTCRYTLRTLELVLVIWWCWSIVKITCWRLRLLVYHEISVVALHLTVGIVVAVASNVFIWLI